MDLEGAKLEQTGWAKWMNGPELGEKRGLWSVDASLTSAVEGRQAGWERLYISPLLPESILLERFIQQSCQESKNMLASHF